MESNTATPIEGENENRSREEADTVGPPPFLDSGFWAIAFKPQHSESIDALADGFASDTGRVSRARVTAERATRGEVKNNDEEGQPSNRPAMKPREDPPRRIAVSGARVVGWRGVRCSAGAEEADTARRKT